MSTFNSILDILRLLVDLHPAAVGELDEMASTVHGSRTSVIRALIAQLNVPAVQQRVRLAEHVAHGGRRLGAGRPRRVQPGDTKVSEIDHGDA